MTLRRSAQRLWMLLLAALAAAPLHAGLPGGWHEVRSAHFRVVGNEGEGRLRTIAAHFERVRSLFERVLPDGGEATGSALLVLVARDEQTFGLLAPSTVKAHGKAGNVGGVFFARPTMELVVIRADFDLDTGLEIVNHEYFHHLVKREGLRLPVWLNEGLADFWGSAKLKDDKTEVGRILEYRLAALKEARRIPFERLMQVDGLSPEYRNPALTRILYGEAWALVHYAMLGDDTGARAQQLGRYFAAVAKGEESLAAAKAAFGDLRELQNQVDGYARRRIFKFASSAAVPPPPESSLASKRLSEAEAAATIALAQLHYERLATVEPRLKEAIAGAPELPTTHAAAGLAALYGRRPDEAAKEFELAAASPETGPLAPYGVAVAAIAREGSKADFEKVEQWLLQAIARDARFVPAYSRLSDVYLRRPGEERRSLAMMRKARALAPQNHVFELREAQILQRLGDATGARSAIDRVVASGLESESWGYQNNLCWDGALLGFAKELLKVCDQAVAASKGDAAVRDSRGVARALAGDLAGAADDLRAVIAAERREDREGFLPRRRGWLAELDKGANPLTPAELQALRDSPADSGLWGE